MKARIIVTTECRNRCSYCCNTPAMLATAKPFTSWGQLGYPDEIMITGGEPQLVDLNGYIVGARMIFPNAKVYMYTTIFTCSTQQYLYDLHGVQFTIHKHAGSKAIEDFYLMEDSVRRAKVANPAFSARLSIIKGADVSIEIDTAVWDSIKMIDFIPECPLPADEELWIAKNTTALATLNASEWAGQG